MRKANIFATSLLFRSFYIIYRSHYWKDLAHYSADWSMGWPLSERTILGWLRWDLWLLCVHSVKVDWDKPPSPPPIACCNPSSDRSDKWRTELHSSSLPTVHCSWVSCIEVVTYCEAEPIRAHITHHSWKLPPPSTEWQPTSVQRCICMRVSEKSDSQLEQSI